MHCIKVCIASTSPMAVITTSDRPLYPYCVPPHTQAGITTSDRLLAVSAGFAEEIQTFLGGWGMEDLLQQRSPVINGITNGIDME